MCAFISYIGCQSAEYTVLCDFYSKLIDALHFKPLIPFLVAEHVLTTQDKENLDQIPSRKGAAEYVLAKISAPLKADFENCSVSFYKFLTIAKQHGNDDTVLLCNDIEQQLIKQKLKVQ